MTSAELAVLRDAARAAQRRYALALREYKKARREANRRAAS